VNHESIHNHSAFARLEWRRQVASSQWQEEPALVARTI
jgi:hypothetical protein